jgi:hypothetical protein
VVLIQLSISDFGAEKPWFGAPVFELEAMDTESRLCYTHCHCGSTCVGQAWINRRPHTRQESRTDLKIGVQ